MSKASTTGIGRAFGSVVLAVALAIAFAPNCLGAEVTLDNGVVGDGHFSVTVDDYGSFGDAFTGGPQWPDFFDPSADPIEGELGEEFATFMSTVLLFIDTSGTGVGSSRGVLSTHAGILGNFANPSMECTITSENSIANLPLSTASSFQCTDAGGISFNISLTQSVSALPAGKNGEALAQLEQTYSITNSGASTTLTIVKHIDEDMPWGGGASFWLDDLVGADFAAIGRPQVYAQDRELTTAALVLRTREDMTKNPMTIDGGFSYYAGKQGLTVPPGNPNYPGGMCPAQDFGTDTEVWDNYGAPNCWKNFVPGVGYNVPGISPQVSGDSFIGLQTEADIAAGQTYEVTFSTLYGFRPPPTVVIPPLLTAQTVEYDQDTGCGDFLWTLQNINPIIVGETPIEISEFYLDIEAGSGGQICTDMTPPPGWTVELCDGYTNGHALYKFSGGAPLALNARVSGRFKIDTNGSDPTTDPVTNITVGPLAVVIHAAQGQDDAACSFTFGPAFSGDWGLRTIAIAHLPVPSASWWARIVLGLAILTGGAVLVLRSRKRVAS